MRRSGWVIVIWSLWAWDGRAEIPLLSRFPELAAAAPRVPLLEGPTPLARLAALERRLRSSAGAPEGSTLWVKKDDLSHRLLGGNKARKLEWLLGRARADGVRTLVTAGMYGSNHALATAIAGRQHGFGVELILGPQPITDDVREKLLAFHALGARLRYHKTKVGMTWDMLRATLADWTHVGGVRFIPPGGSTREGALGYANAFLELVDQTAELPERIVVPVGTGGTAGGLLLGTCLAGLWEKVEILGVGVADKFLAGEGAVRRDAAAGWEVIRNALPRARRGTLPVCDFRRSQKAFVYVEGYLAPGYGVAKPEVYEAIRLVLEAEAIRLEPTYSGKAMRFLLDDVSARLRQGRVVPRTLFWQTYNSHELRTVIDSYPWKNPERRWRDLPKPFWSFFEGSLEAEQVSVDPVHDELAGFDEAVRMAQILLDVAIQERGDPGSDGAVLGDSVGSQAAGVEEATAEQMQQSPMIN